MESTPDRAQRRKQERRVQILDAAQKVFAQKGYHQTGIADIAAEIGMGHGTFYRYFENKRDVFEQILERIMRQVAAVVFGEHPQAAENLEQYRAQVRRIGESLMTLFLDDASLSRIVHYESLGLDQELRGRVQLMMDGFAGFTEQYLLNGLEKGFLRPDLDTRVTAQAINAMIFEAAKRLSGSPNRQRDKGPWLEALIRMMFDGIGGTQ
ncbi:MAG: TetR/AcrR family transcriptional regulator [Candidatus Alcyoniella australis]|nr:TetR/AcrR family transcriptional regulator [Candidatus Alcyoniella australis]